MISNKLTLESILDVSICLHYLVIPLWCDDVMILGVRELGYLHCLCRVMPKESNIIDHDLIGHVLFICIKIYFCILFWIEDASIV
jgi:hypothetical protein